MRLRRRKFTTETFQFALEQKYPNEYLVLGEYTLSKNPIRVQHLKCGHIWEPIANNLLNVGTKCPHCSTEKKRARLKQDTPQRKYSFIDKVKDLTADEYTVLGDYVNGETHILMKHNLCGHEWMVRPEKFLYGNRCPRCNRGPVSEDDASMRLIKTYGDRFSILHYGNGVNCESLIKDNVCGHTYKTTVAKILSSKNFQCPTCRDIKHKRSLLKKALHKRKIANKTLMKRQQIDNTQEKYIVTWDNDSDLSGTLTCRLCGHSVHHDSIGITMLRSNCSNCKIRVTDTHSLKEAVCFLSNQSYEAIGNYVSSTTPTEFIHHSCGTTFSKKPNHIINQLKGHKDPCPVCGNRKCRAKTNDEFQEDIDLKFGKGVFSLLSDYKDGRTAVNVRHVCGYEYTVLPDALLDPEKSPYSGCPGCTSSRSVAEKQIEDLLKASKVRYKSQYIDERCKHVRPLPFDFAVFAPNSDIPSFLIEFDGQQHYSPIDYFGGQAAFESQLQRDTIKDQFVCENDIWLIRIPYWEQRNITNIIVEALLFFDLIPPKRPRWLEEIIYTFCTTA